MVAKGRGMRENGGELSQRVQTFRCKLSSEDPKYSMVTILYCILEIC